MAIIYGRTIGYIDAEEPIPPEPEASAYTWNKTITTAQDLIIDTTGWYKIYVIGNGGSAGRSIDRYCYDCRYGNDYAGDYLGPANGGSGGLGGYAVHQVYLKNGNVIKISTDSTKWQVEVGGNIIYATHGGAGGAGQITGSSSTGFSRVHGAGGTAGTASGGNLINHDGVAGGQSTNTGWGGSGVRIYGGRRSTAVKYQNNNGTGASVTTGANTSLGTSGSVRNPGYCDCSDTGSSSCRPCTNPYTTNMVGGSGGVILEIVEG